MAGMTNVWAGSDPSTSVTRQVGGPQVRVEPVT